MAMLWWFLATEYPTISLILTSYNALSRELQAKARFHLMAELQIVLQDKLTVKANVKTTSLRSVFMPKSITNNTKGENMMTLSSQLHKYSQI